MEILKYGSLLKRKRGKFTRSIFSGPHFHIVHKRGFSLLELLIVLMIVGILFMAFKGYFQIKDKDTLYGQACIETVYGQVNNFLYAGLSSKGLFSGTGIKFPDHYILRFDPAAKKIELQYIEQENTVSYTGIYSSIVFTGNTNMMYCSSNRYTIQLTGEAYEIHINKGFQENADLKSFYLTSLTGTYRGSTGESIFLQCNNQGTGCKTIARFESDTRIVGLKKQICLKTNDIGDCSNNLTGENKIEYWDN